jgi:ATP-binding cassette, subfamily B, multidrug efflux pump
MSENKVRAMRKKPMQNNHHGPGGGPGGPLGRPVEKAKNFKGTLKRLLGYLKPQVPKLVIVLIFAVLSTIFVIRTPKIMGEATNELSYGYISQQTVNTVSDLQKKMAPQMKAQLSKIDEAEDAAVKQSNAAIKEQAEANVTAKKQQAYAAAVQKADAAVESQFAKQPAAQIAAAKKQAEKAAKDAVDTEFAKQQPTIDAQISTAQQDAAEKIKAQIEKTVLEKANLTSEQLDAMKEIISLPNVKDIKDNNEKADTIQKLVDLSNKLPSSSNKTSEISKADLDKGISYVRTYGGAIPFDAIWKTLMFLLALYLLSSLFQFVMQYIMSGVAQKTVFTLRRDVDEKISRLPLKYFDSHPNGDTLSRMTNDIDTISTTLQQSLTQLITALLQLAGYVWMMFTISWQLTLIVLATLPLYILVTAIIAKRSQKYYASQQKHLGELSGHTEEMFTGHVIVKAFGHEEDSIETFKEINDDLYNVGWKAQFMSGIMMPLMNFIGNIAYVLIAVVGGIFATKSLLGIGDIVAFITYSKSFSQPIIQTANIANIIQSTVACAERVFELLDEKDEIPDSDAPAVIEDPQGNIIFDHVDFRYVEDQPLIEDMNLDIKRGETIAIVGPTGAGKTTLVNLLMRFYEINGGSITFDGVNLKNMRRGELRKMFGMVLQDTWLFNGTIHDNIAYGRENTTEDEIIAAAKAAHADRFIRSLPDGYNTVLNEEASNISQGQKQLLTIARALLADPTVLILDEATSSVDTRTEVLIQKAMGKLMQGRTNFVIAHRLSTIRDAKIILVMNHGKIIEKGNHKELLAKAGFYADLYNSQFTGASVG